jgi:hypothetical protein
MQLNGLEPEVTGPLSVIDIFGVIVGVWSRLGSRRALCEIRPLEDIGGSTCISN